MLWLALSGAWKLFNQGSSPISVSPACNLQGAYNGGPTDFYSVSPPENPLGPASWVALGCIFVWVVLLTHRTLSVLCLCLLTDSQAFRSSQEAALHSYHPTPNPTEVGPEYQANK